VEHEDGVPAGEVPLGEAPGGVLQDDGGGGGGVVDEGDLGDVAGADEAGDGGARAEQPLLEAVEVEGVGLREEEALPAGLRGEDRGRAAAEAAVVDARDGGVVVELGGYWMVGVAAGAREEAEEDGEGALRNGEVREREEAPVEGQRGERRRVREEEVGEERREEGGAGREEREEERWGGRRVGEEEAREVGDGRGKEWRGGAARRREEAEGLSVK